MTRYVLPALWLCIVFAGASMGSDKIASREFAFDLWDWTAPCRDIEQFRVWAADLKSIGVTRLEISAPWNLLEPQRGKYDLSFIADRLAIAKSLKLGLRVRINSYYAGATPGWLKADRWQDIDGKPPRGTPEPVSINDDRFWESFAPLCSEIARTFKREDVLYSPFIAVHAELKWADWWTYDPSSLALWRQSIASPRPAWLREVVADDVELPQTPPIPRATLGVPDTAPASLAFIAFREHCWRTALARFNQAIRAGDPDARTSAPLGESFRRQSAEFSNLDYRGLSRGFDQVVHSYDFFWHRKDDAWYAGAAVASFRGITQVPVTFEFDGPALTDSLGYTQERLLAIADAAVEQGSGLKAANYSGDPRLPSSYPILRAFGQRIGNAPPPPESAPSQTILLFVSKWANYCYREKTEWLHDAQFGAWQMLRSHDYPVRIICEDNLDEALSEHRGLYVAFSPRPLIPTAARAKLDALCGQLPSIIELKDVPAAPPTGKLSEVRADARDSSITLNQALAYAWINGDRDAADHLLARAIARTWRDR